MDQEIPRPARTGNPPMAGSDLRGRLSGHAGEEAAAAARLLSDDEYAEDEAGDGPVAEADDDSAPTTSRIAVRYRFGPVCRERLEQPGSCGSGQLRTASHVGEVSSRGACVPMGVPRRSDRSKGDRSGPANRGGRG